MDWSAVQLALIAALLAAAALGAALGALIRARRQPVPVLSPELAVALVRDDAGLRRLRAQTRRTDRWWVDAEPADLEAVDRSLSMWDAVASYAQAGVIDRLALLGLFGGRIVETWEQAFPYVLARRAELPALWASLGDLYVDAFEAATAGEQPARFPLSTWRHDAPSPADVELPTPPPVEVEVEPAEEAPAAVQEPAAAVREPPAEAEEAARPSVPQPTGPRDVSDERLALWTAALREEARGGLPAGVTVGAVTVPSAGTRRPPPSAPAPRRTAPRPTPPPALHAAPALEHVIDIVTRHAGDPPDQPQP